MKTPAPGRRRARVSRYAGHEGGEGPVSERNAAVSGRRKTPPPSVTAPQGGGRETAYRGLSPGIGATMQGGGSIAALVFGVRGRRKNPKFRYLRGDVREEADFMPRPKFGFWSFPSKQELLLCSISWINALVCALAINKLGRCLFSAPAAL